MLDAQGVGFGDDRFPGDRFRKYAKEQAAGFGPGFQTSQRVLHGNGRTPAHAHAFFTSAPLGAIRGV
jgi:hypothetical protein